MLGIAAAFSCCVVFDVWADQVLPFVVASIVPEAPTAQQSFASTQLIPCRFRLTPEVCVDHVVPPLVVVMISAVPRLGAAPAAKQTLALTHEIALSAAVAPEGAACDDQVEPPLVVAMISAVPPVGAAPTAKQTLALTHEIALSAAVAPDGGACDDQVGLELLAVVVAMIAGPVPTAQQALDVPHERPSRFCVVGEVSVAQLLAANAG
jgi:hypothetical protein